MKVPPELYHRHLTDADTEALFVMFDEPPGARVLEVGAHDEPVANVLAACAVLGMAALTIDRDCITVDDEPATADNVGELFAGFADADAHLRDLGGLADEQD